MKARSGLPVPLAVKQVWKSGPMKLRRFLWNICSSCLPCGLQVLWLNAVCAALRSAMRYTGMFVWLKSVFMSAYGRPVLGLAYVVEMRIGPRGVKIFTARK